MNSRYLYTGCLKLESYLAICLVPSEVHSIDPFMIHFQNSLFVLLLHDYSTFSSKVNILVYHLDIKLILLHTIYLY